MNVLFLCGSPRHKRSASLCTAKYLARFLDYDYEFVDVAKAKLSTDPGEADPDFLKIVVKMQAADAVVWTFGAGFCLFRCKCSISSTSCLYRGMTSVARSQRR